VLTHEVLFALAESLDTVFVFVEVFAHATSKLAEARYLVVVVISHGASLAENLRYF
jgi:hypothetical protein